MKSREKELFVIYLLVDLFILNSCFVVLNLFRHDVYVREFNQHLMYFIHFNVCWIIAYFAFRKRNLYLRDGFSNRIYRITLRVLIYIAIASITAFLLLPKYYSRYYFVEHIAFFYIGMISAYFFIYKYLKYKRKRGLNTNRAVIISNCETANKLRKIIESNDILGYKFLGFVVHDNSQDQPDVLGSTVNLESLIRDHQIQMIFSIQNTDNQVLNQSLASICDKDGVRLRFVPEYNHLYKLQHNVETIAGIALLNPREIPLDDVGARIRKRFFDIFFSLSVILFVFTWLLPIVALIIKLTSKGPVFFCQKRTGINKKTFTCLKFRSMKLNGFSDIKQASAKDNRITTFGRFLRHTWIDEFPQFINVFLGQMSVVGPRPHMLVHTAQYSELIMNYLIRHNVKPGITGWAQINGCCGETDELWKMEKRVEYDMLYINNWSFYWDLKIIWNTIFRVDQIKIHSFKSVFLHPAPKGSQRTSKTYTESERIMSEV